MSSLSEVVGYLWLIPLLPLVAAVATAFLGPLLRDKSHWPCVLACAGSCVLSVMALLAVHDVIAHHPGADHAQTVTLSSLNRDYYTWFAVEDVSGRPQVNVSVGLRIDPLTAIMLAMITFIGTLIAIFSIGYMHGEKGYPRFFAAVALFVAAMTLLVSADNFLVLFVGWEGVGLCSYLLIGFWFTKPSAAAAARKAFLVTRIGDVGLLLGIFLLWAVSGNHFDFEGVFSWAVKATTDAEYMRANPNASWWIFAACLLLFSGAVGKSAQFPLHVWLPDAMEGPTPVSALIHAATMVTAGVYLLARCTVLFAASPGAQVTVATLGGVTMLLAALIALTQNDLKRVLAYSTLSQLGYMFLALGCALASRNLTDGKDLVTFAVIAGMFHLFTHAFFKALLFLSSGSVMHAMGGIDMTKFGGLRRIMPITHVTFLAGALALAAFPFTSGFWSKDEILTAAHEAGLHTRQYAGVYQMLFYAGMATAALTGFYTFRAYFKTFWGPLKIPHEAGHHAHESPLVMTAPLMILAVFALGVGYVAGPMTHAFAHTLQYTVGMPEMPQHKPDIPLMITSSVLAVGGIATAWWFYVLAPALPGRLARGAYALYQISYQKFYIDEIYDFVFVKPVDWLKQAAATFDKGFIDKLVDLCGQIPRGIGYLFRPVQNGLLQFYALAMIMGLTVFLLALVRSL